MIQGHDIKVLVDVVERHFANRSKMRLLVVELRATLKNGDKELRETLAAIEEEVERRISREQQR
jgi:hypothetical protein